MNTISNKLAKILSESEDNIMFLHNTRYEETAKLIMKEGFQFEEQLTFSTDRVNPKDAVEISYFLVERKEYGSYTMIIEINREIFKKFNYLADSADFHFEELITVMPPVLSDNDEFIYRLSHHYIKGYFDIKTGNLITNPDFDPTFESPLYLDNFNRLKR